MDRLLTDIRFAIRQAASRPGIALAVVAIVAVTIGATTTVFSLYNALVLRSLPVADPSRIVLVQPIDGKGQNRPLYHETYRELARLPVFEHLALYSGGGLMLNEARGVRTEGLIEAVTPGFFEALGLRPFLGRFFVERDFQDPDSPVVVISHAMWQRLYGGDPRAIGEQIVINAHPMTVVGVTPPDFKGFYVDSGFGFSVPLSVLNKFLGTDPNRPLRGLQAIGRLRPGVSIQQAEAAVAASWDSLRTSAVPAQLDAPERREIASSRVKVEGLAGGFSTLRTRFQGPLGLLLAATVVLLVIGCVNLSGLLLARTAARDHQFAILLALGAPRARFVRQVVAETVLLSLVGTLMSLPLAWWGSTMLTNTIWMSQNPIALRTSPDGVVLLVAIGVALATAVVMALVPAARAARHRNLALRSERTVAAPLGFWGRGLLVVQIALSTVLLVGAGLFATSLWNLRHIDAGVAHADVRWSRLFALPGSTRPRDLQAHHASLLRQIQDLPEVESAAMGSLFPTYFNASQFLTRHSVGAGGSAPADSPVGDALVEQVSPGFFDTVGIPRRLGRDLASTDTAGAPPVAVISETLARRVFGEASAIGNRIRVDADPKRANIEVVGVVADASIGDLRDPHVPVVYLARWQEAAQAPVLLFRPKADVASTEAAIQQVIAAGHYDYPRGWFSIADNVDATLLQERLLAALSTFLALVAVTLASVGVYALLSFSVTRRAREFGIRAALGANPAALRRMVMVEALAVAGCGIGIGLAAALALGRVAASLLFDMTPSNPAVLASAALCFLVVTAIAVARPAARAARVDAASTLTAQ